TTTATAIGVIMSVPSPETIREFLQTQFSCWNANQQDQMFAACKRVAGSGLTVEYVGGPELDGWPALEAMWEKNHRTGKPNIGFEIVEILFTGNEAACYLRNDASAPHGPIASPSIELYRFGSVTMHARYSHYAH